MRLPGTYSYAKPSKAAKGYRTELVTSKREGTVTTPELLMRGLNYVAPAASSSLHSERRLPIGDTSLMARNQDELLRVIAAMPNELEDRDSWVALSAAIKAGCGGSEEGYMTPMSNGA